MAKASEPSVTDDDIFFELERFEPSDGRLTLTGRWFGVRGRRFVRPTLTLAVDGERARALADLDDKPWAAEDGEPWQASFPWGKTGRVEEPELSVAPDITIELPVPGAKRGRSQRLAAQPRRDAMTASWGSFTASPAAPVLDEAPPAEAGLSAPDEEPDAPLPEAPAPAPDPAALQAEIEALRIELTQASSTAAENSTDLASARDELSSVRSQLKESQRELGLRDGELEALRAELSATRAAREAALRSAAQAEADREVALTRAAEAESDRDALAADKAGLASALEERRTAVEQLTRQQEEAVASRGAALVMRGATQALPAYDHHVGWTRRVLAVVVLLGIALALLIVLGAF
ncbi:MAG TPA: hypothetical protein VMD09_12235 [Solirubrobacteraceae bacterium]|nr:hypothetical protein [Solirubrobacteraceae bacterium]